MYRTLAINSVGQLIGQLQKHAKSKDPVWYRGHADSAWNLLPWYQRLKSPPPESVLVKRFKQNAHLLVSNVGDNDFDWLFYLQHYGVPTRLLDWSESPLVAIYFAVTSLPKKEGALWALKPLDLNRLATANPKDSKFLPSFEDTLLENYSTKNVEASTTVNGVLPMAAIATRNNPRIQAQLGVFTIAHLTRNPIDSIGSGDHLVKYTISPMAKIQLLAELRLLGITKFQLFPELASAGDLVKELL